MNKMEGCCDKGIEMNHENVQIEEVKYTIGSGRVVAMVLCSSLSC